MSAEHSFLIAIALVLCTLIGSITFYKVTELEYSCTKIEAAQ